MRPRARSPRSPRSPRLRAAALALCLAPALAGCTARAPEDPARAVARKFWSALASGDLWAAIQVSSFPFALDAHADCLAGPRELSAALEWQRGDGSLRIELGATRRITPDVELDARWRERRARFLDPQARCLSARDALAPSPGADGLHYFLVDFTVDGEPVGALTRVRCEAGDCGVAGIEN
ncbi:MAG: hypothetical protein H6713_04425 [Myxococcales bacterium]|nr:hypothetical protein [Myxococcales bacterium]MCB9749237.1 hypothetical protein [Myxococcales bacterium]